jgi:SET domain-containing protein
MPATEVSSPRKPRKPVPSPSASPESALAPSVVVRKSGIQGRGVFAIRKIPKGALIVEYLGKRMTHDEVGDRYDDESVRRHHTFLFSIDDELCIDGGQNGNEARLINHSCAPNAFAEIEKRRIFIRAERAIEPGEEVVYDYWYSTDPDYTLADLKRIYPCRCGAATCRGTLAAPPKKPRAKKPAPKKASAAKAKTSAAKKSKGSERKKPKAPSRRGGR